MNYQKQYGQMHKNPKMFQGFSLKHHIEDIQELISLTDAKYLLDYGCGKGKQYTEKKMHHAWGVPMPTLYDPGVPEFRDALSIRGGLDVGWQFDGIICTDVMEHIEEDDVDSIFADIFKWVKMDGFVFFCISCRPAKRKKLPDGRNVHLTVKPPEWWEDKLKSWRDENPGVYIMAAYEQKEV